MIRISTTNRELAIKNFSNSFFIHLLEGCVTTDKLVFICIGTPLIPGDSLGPMIGDSLKRYSMKNVSIYGTKEEPIHALNLKERLSEIKKKHPDAFFIAIDASFGTRIHLGNICIHHGPLFPGAGVKKELPPIGNLSITGIVCANGPFRNKRLERISLKKIASQADIISLGIFQAILTLAVSERRIPRSLSDAK